MSKRKTPAQALEEFLSYYDESILEYRYALRIRSLKRTNVSRTFFMKWNLPRTGTKGTGLQTSLQQSRRTRRINKDMAKMNEKLVKFSEGSEEQGYLKPVTGLLGQQEEGRGNIFWENVHTDQEQGMEVIPLAKIKITRKLLSSYRKLKREIVVLELELVGNDGRG